MAPKVEFPRPLRPSPLSQKLWNLYLWFKNNYLVRIISKVRSVILTSRLSFSSYSYHSPSHKSTGENSVPLSEATAVKVSYNIIGFITDFDIALFLRFWHGKRLVQSYDNPISKLFVISHFEYRKRIQFFALQWLQTNINEYLFFYKTYRYFLECDNLCNEWPIEHHQEILRFQLTQPKIQFHSY